MPNDIKGGYHLSDTIFDLTHVNLPYEIDENLQFHRASTEQIASLKQIAGSLDVDLTPCEFNQVQVTDTASGSVSSNWEPLSVHSFRYLVLAYRGNGLVASDFVKFASVLEPPIHFSCHCRTTIEFGYGERRSHGHMPLHNRKLFQPDVIASPLSHASLEKIRVDWTAYQEVRALFPILEKALGMLFDLNMIPRHHDLYLLGLFAIVELLLTHNPQNKENADSINHQISTKMPLLSQRMERKPHYQLFGSFSTGSVAKLRTVPR